MEIKQKVEELVDEVSSEALVGHKKRWWIIGMAAGVIVLGIVAAWLWGRRSTGQELPILPTQLMPYVSPQQARATICGTMTGQLFAEACQGKYENVGKNDTAKIGALFLLLKNIEDDRSVSDYERALLAQVVFASLPTKDSPLAHRTGVPIAYAQETGGNVGVGEKAFKQKTIDDLTTVVNNLPAGNNAWVVTVMVSQHAWVNGERQPIYSEQYSESHDPFPGVSTEPKDRSKILYNVRSIVGSRATSQAMYEGSFTGTGEMVSYSFTIMSWNSPPYGSDSVLVVAESGPEAKHFTSRYNFTEENYQGADLLADLLAAVPMPSVQPVAPDEPIETGGQTSWGSPDEQETAYEAYFWMHLQDPSRFPNLWVLLADDQEFSGRVLRSLPLGEPVDLREYFKSREVREYYEFLRQNTTTTLIPPLDDFLNSIDQYQANLSAAKPPEEEEPVEEDTNVIDPAGEDEYRRWLDCIGDPNRTGPCHGSRSGAAPR